jgi:hypothetical protein
MGVTISSSGNWYHVAGSVASVLSKLHSINKDKIVGATGDGTNLYVTYGKN